MSLISNTPVGSSVGLGTNAPVGKLLGAGQNGSAITSAPVGATVGLGVNGSAISNQSAITNAPVGATLRIDPPATPTPQVTTPTATSPVDRRDDAAAANATPANPVSRGFADAIATPVPPPSPFASAQGFAATVAGKIQQNALNQYWQPTYHFRLFMAGDKDLIGAGGNTQSISAMMSKINGNTVDRVILAESGVTGYNIKEVVIDSVIAQNAVTREQTATQITMTITEPMGISFLDGLSGAGTLLGVYDYTKMVFYLQLSFTGYNPDGSFALDPIPGLAKNGGQWLYGCTLVSIDTKINEGSAVYTLTLMTNNSEALLLEKKIFTAKKAITVQGKTLNELFTSYAKALTDAGATELGKDQQGKPLVTFTIDASHPVWFGTGTGKKPQDFVLSPVQPDLSDIRNLPLGAPAKDGTYTVTVPAGMSVNDFIAASIRSTEQGQALIKDVPITAQTNVSDTQVNAKKYRASALFSIETDIQNVKFDAQTGNYQKLVVIHVIPSYSQTGAISREEVTNAADPAAQRGKINDLLNYGFLKKQYNYIFTGLNTEVIDFDITFNLAFQQDMPKQLGDGSGYLSEATQAKYNQAGADVPLTTLDTKTLNSTGSGATYYVEDILTRLNQGQNPLPISFSTNYHETERNAGVGTPVQYHRDRALCGAIFTQKYYAAFQTIELNIRGDPYWLGQTNIERQILLRAGNDPHDNDAGVDFSTGNPTFILYFRYPLQIGDDFKPILKDSAVFNGLYEVVQVKHTFTDGAFKQTLTANRLTEIDLTVAYTADSNSTLTSQNSPPTQNANAGSNGSGTPGSGSTPGTAASSGTANPNDPRGIRNNNPTNLSYVSGQPGVQGSDGRFGTYATMDDGIGAAQNQLLINQNQHGANTVTAQITRWAPPGENNTQSYIATVSQQLNVDPTQPIDVSNPQVASVLLAAQIKVETGRVIDPAIVASGVAKGNAAYASMHV